MVQETVMELLRRGLWGKAFVADEVIEANLNSFDSKLWQEFYEWTIKQTITCNVLDGFSTLPPRCQPPGQIKANMMMIAVRNAQAFNLLDRTAAQLTYRFAKEGIPSLVLKGQGIARLYKNPAARQCGDVDLLVRRKDYKRAILLSKGLDADQAHARESSVHHYVLHMNNGVCVEIHNVPSYSPFKKFREYIVARGEECVESSPAGFAVSIPQTPEPVVVKTPDEDFNAIFIFYHMFRHYTNNGVGLRQLNDWAMVLYHAKNLNLLLLEQLLEASSLMRPWQSFGALLVKQLGLPQQKFPFYNSEREKDVAELMAQIVKSGNFGQFMKRKDSKRYVLHKLYSFSFHTRYKFRIFLLFPKLMLIIYAQFICKGIKQIGRDFSERKQKRISQKDKRS